MNRFRRVFVGRGFGPLILAQLLAATTGLSDNAYAGAGSIDTAAKTVDLNVLFTYQETTDRLTGATEPNWQKVFNEASKRLWNATNGQLRIGKVHAYLRALGKKDDADVWIANKSGGAYATGIAKLGVSGDHMQFYAGTHRSLSGYKGDFSIVHEMGHYVFGLYDEYLGTSVPLAKKDTWTSADFGGWISNNANIYSISPTSHAASIMDGGGGVTPANDRTEFDTAGNVNKGVANGSRWYITKQWAEFRKSCWETMAGFSWKGVKVFPTVPTGDSDTAMPAAYSDIQFEVVPTLNRLVLTVDHSGSMDYDNKLELAKQGASIFVSLAEEPHKIVMFKGTTDEETITIDPDYLGVVQFDDRIGTVFPMTAIDDGGSVKTNARAAIDSIGSGNMTAVWDAARYSLGLITAQGAKVSGEAIILLTDGQDNSSGSSISTVAASAKSREAKIYTIGLGSDADAASLSSLALATGGKYYQATDGFALMSIYPEIYSELKGGGLLDAVSSLLHEGDAATHEVRVDSLTQEVTFAVTSPDTGWRFSIQAPNGTRYSGSVPAAGVLFEDNATAQWYRVNAPAAGIWKMVVNAPATTTDSNYQYNVLTSAASPAVELSASTDRQSYIYPQAILVKAKLTAGDPVAGAEVTASVSGPNGVIGRLTLYDDGLAEHGDDTANDGQYSAYYRGMQGNGVYTFDLVANNVKGVQGIALPEKTATAFKAKAIPAFTRTSTVSATVSGAPTIDRSWLRVDAMTVTRNRGSNTGTIKLALTLNNLGLDADQLRGTAAIAEDLLITAESSWKTVDHTSFRKSGKQSGIFTISPVVKTDTTVSGSLKADIGGSSRSQMNLVLKQVPLSGFSFTGKIEAVNLRVQWGSFDETLSLNAVVQSANQVAYLATKDYANTPELYINGIKVDLNLLKTNADTFRLVANFSGGGVYNPATHALYVELGGFAVTVPAGTLTKVGSSAVAKGEIAYAGGTLKITVDSDKRLLTLRGTALSLAGTMSDTVVSALTVGSVFTDRNLLVLSHTLTRRIESFSY